MSERAITQRVQVLGLQGLSAHDCRHHWARKVDLPWLQEAGGWSSLATLQR